MTEKKSVREGERNAKTKTAHMMLPTEIDTTSHRLENRHI